MELTIKTNTKELYIQQLPCRNDGCFVMQEICCRWYFIVDESNRMKYPFPKDKFLIGYITKKGEFSFDSSEYVHRYESGRYFHYIDPETRHCETKEVSFISLLESHGAYLENPMGSRPIHPEHQEELSYRDALEDRNKWYQYQSKTLKEGHIYLVFKDK